MNEILLEDTYALVKVKQVLLAEGYTNEQIEFLLEKGLWDKIKRGVAIGTAAAGMMGASAHGSDASEIGKSVADLHANAPRIAQQIGADSYKAAAKSAQSEESMIEQTAQKAFGGNISDGGLRALKSVISRLDFRDPKKADKIVKLIDQTAQILSKKGQNEMEVYNTANDVSSRISR